MEETLLNCHFFQLPLTSMLGRCTCRRGVVEKVGGMDKVYSWGVGQHKKILARRTVLDVIYAKKPKYLIFYMSQP
jgi:hypothetical protein